MAFIKSFFKGFLILMFLPFYWLYTIIGGIAFRGKLNDYPRVKKDATAKHLILAAISLFVFAIFGSTSSETSSPKANTDIVFNDTYIETAELLESETESTQEDIYTSLIDETDVQATIETASSKSSDNYDTDYELSDEDISNYESSGGISPYYHPPIEEDTYSESTYYENSNYESYVESDNNYEQTVEESSDIKDSIDNNTQSENYTLVWIDDTAPRYHSSADAHAPNFQMDNPRQVTLEKARDMGKTACGRCYK